jgi:hypothetical protein
VHRVGSLSDMKDFHCTDSTALQSFRLTRNKSISVNYSLNIVYSTDLDGPGRVI